MGPSRGWPAIFVSLLVGVGSARGQIAVQPGWSTDEFVARTAALEIVLDREPEPSEGRLAIVVGMVDLTDLFVRDGARLRYRPDLLALPSGDSEVAVFLVSPANAWVEVGRFPLRVLTKRGFESSVLQSRLDAESLGLLDEGEESDSGEEGALESWTGQIDVQGGSKRPGLGLEYAINVFGTSEIDRALRFGTEGEEAEKVDLASYRLRLERGRGYFELGHLAHGSSRHLIENFASRGAVLGLPLGSRADLSFGAMNGTTIVGWDNPFGLADSDHQVLTGRLGFELRPDTPGALRFEGTVLDGSLVPLTDFNQGLVNDSEDSDGWSARLVGAAAGDRFRFDAAWSESDFTNPFDESLAQGEALVPVKREKRDAHYVDLEAGLWRKTTKTQRVMDLRLGARHRRIEPMYRTVAAFVQADIEELAFDLTGTFGAVLAQVSWSDGEDNLDDVSSILKTNTGRRAMSLTVPLADFFARPPADAGASAQEVKGGSGAAYPSLSIGIDRTHQYGAGVPENSGFNPSHVPDQISLNETLGLDWSGARWRAGYRFGYSDQDNRQIGRERADFTGLNHAFRFGLSPHAKLDLDFDLSTEQADNEEFGEQADTDRYGVGFTSPLAAWLTLTGRISVSATDTSPAARVNDASVLDLQASFRIYERARGRHGSSLRAYLRYDRQDLELEDIQFGVSQDQSFWSLHSGLNFSVY